MVRIEVLYRGKKVELYFEKDKVTAGDVLKALGLSRQYAFVVKNGEVVSEEEPIKPEDQVRVINAISGGKNL